MEGNKINYSFLAPVRKFSATDDQRGFRIEESNITTYYENVDIARARQRDASQAEEVKREASHTWLQSRNGKL
jgi:hypothetical protein